MVRQPTEILRETNHQSFIKHISLEMEYRLEGVFEKKVVGSLSSNVFERRTSTGSEVFSLLTCLDDIKFIFLSFFTVIEAI